MNPSIRFCAKGGHPYSHQSNFVCPKHLSKPGKYTHCHWCGGEMPTESMFHIHEGCKPKNRK